MENSLDIGGRTGKEILVDSAYTPEEIALLEKNGVTPEEVAAHWVNSNGADTLISAIGAVLMSRDGRGSEERNIKNQTQAEADASAMIDPCAADASIENVNELGFTPPPDTAL